MTLEELARSRKLSKHRRDGKLCTRDNQECKQGEPPKYRPFIGKFESPLVGEIKPKWRSVPNKSGKK
jgi:hypothetical protein